MSEELVMWVDEQGNLIKPIPISLANSDSQYLHLEVAVLIVDQEGRVLLQKRAATKKVAPNVWTVAAAGHVTYGQTSDEAAARELEEEMGIVIDNLIPLFREKVNLEHESHFADWYIGVYTKGRIVTQKSEVGDYIWLSQHDSLKFFSSHEMSTRTIKMCERYWSGEWNKLLE